MKGVSLPLGFTFSFPCQQNRLDEVTVPSWRALLRALLTPNQPELGAGEEVELREGNESLPVSNCEGGPVDGSE